MGYVAIGGGPGLGCSTRRQVVWGAVRAFPPGGKARTASEVQSRLPEHRQLEGVPLDLSAMVVICMVNRWRKNIDFALGIVAIHSNMCNLTAHTITTLLTCTWA